MADPAPTVVHAQRTVYEALPWLSVTMNDITTPDGVNRSHHSIRLGPVALVTALDDQNRVLMIRRHRWIVEQVGLETPGGIIEADETPEECARRELLEETGFEPTEPLELVATLEPMPGLVQTKHHVFLTRNPRQVAEPSDPEEAGFLEWVPVTDTPDLLARGQLLGAGTGLGLLLALHAIQHAP
ncbi:NUDIX hydrolase [Nocardia farcinica]|uniref:NUDIX hydrolase n=1 Tax=Nocardia farcinica TaxID=37329 RepID=UPI001894996C|nr:NUDIX hydrolase [Nocardia farcinica]MBF6185070.1 NUDIX hydrolase [Nocardia farcinica]MBF6363962.1 NUDIX hydrolase [Nocardia farcinica]